MSRAWVRTALALVLATTAATETFAGQALVTTRTTWQYNDDGAPTAITTQVDDEEPSTVFLTYDNFVPDAADPRSGSTSVGNGRVVAYGPSPGAAAADSRFDFDERDRLVGYADSQRSITYAHHPTGLMKSATAADDSGWRFYYDDATNAQATNLYEPSRARWSAWLDAARFTSDGGEQVLVRPRKDVAGIYDPEQQVVSPLRYDAYGAQPQSSQSEGYDLAENPFQYADEYRDPTWGGIYLRARWYHPDLPTFLSRDPASQQLNHYGYAGANPAMRTDPSGRKWLGRRLKKLNKGPGGHFARFFLSPFLGPLELMAHPSAFWRQVKANKGGIDYFLAAGIAAELFSPVADAALPTFLGSMSLGTRFTVRLITDSVLGLGQSATQSGLLRGAGHFDWHTFAQGAEYTFGGIAWVRLTAGVGYRPFGLKSTGFQEFVRAQGDLGQDEALIFRVKDTEIFRYRGLSLHFGQTSPLQEWKNLGFYHERLIAVTREDVYSSEFFLGDVMHQNEELEDYVSMIERDKSTRYQFVGRKQNFNAYQFDHANPRGFASKEEVNAWKVRLKSNPDEPFPGRKYNTITNNCHDHVSAVIESLGLR